MGIVNAKAIILTLNLILLGSNLSLTENQLSVSVSVSKQVFIPGEVVSISGSTSDLGGTLVQRVSVSVQVNDPSGKIAGVALRDTNEQGFFSYEFILKNDAMTGIYQVHVTASKSGYVDGYAETTFKVSTTSQSSTNQPPKRGTCIIATATYGSELTPQVQFLRTFRDQVVMATFAGAEFMSVFNQFYYSFSPQVADLISTNPGLRPAAQIALHPLIAILGVASVSYQIANFNPELAVVLAGFVSSFLLAFVYSLPFIVFFIPAGRAIRITRLGLVKPTLLFLLTSLSLILVAEGIPHCLLMELGTSMFVLATISLSIVFSTITLSRLSSIFHF